MRFALSALITSVLFCAGSTAQEAKKNGEKPPDNTGSMSKEIKEIKEIAGKDLDAWIKDISHKDPSRRALAMRMVLGFGAQKAQKAVPAIYKELRKHSASVPIDMSVRIDGCMALSTILTNVKDPDAKQVEDAVAIIGRFCKDDQVIVKARAAQALAMFGTRGHASINDVIVVARDLSGWEARQQGLQCLSVLTRLDREPSAAVLSAFYKGLQDNSMQVRITSVQALAMFKDIGPTYSEYPRIIYNLNEHAAKDIEPEVQIWAHLALMQLKFDQKKPAAAPQHLNGISKYLKYHDPMVKLLAVRALGLTGKLAHPEWPKIVAILTDPELEVVLAGIFTLTHMEAIEAVPALESLSESPSMPAPIKEQSRRAIELLKYGKKTLTPVKTPDAGTK